jgi:hypothetical protein
VRKVDVLAALSAGTMVGSKVSMKAVLKVVLRVGRLADLLDLKTAVY